MARRASENGRGRSGLAPRAVPRARLHTQERLNTCGVAALRTVLDLQLGLRIPEQALEAHATTAELPIVKFGTRTSEWRRMVDGVNRTHNPARHGRARWRFRVHALASLEDLARELAHGRFPILRLYSPNPAADYHAVVCLAVQPDGVLLFDPSPTTPRAPELWDPVRFWDAWFGDGVSRWYGVVVTPLAAP